MTRSARSRIEAQVAVTPATVQSRMSSSMALSVTFADSMTSTAIDTDP